MRTFESMWCRGSNILTTGNMWWGQWPPPVGVWDDGNCHRQREYVVSMGQCPYREGTASIEKALPLSILGPEPSIEKAVPSLYTALAWGREYTMPRRESTADIVEIGWRRTGSNERNWHQYTNSSMTFLHDRQLLSLPGGTPSMAVMSDRHQSTRTCQSLP